MARKILQAAPHLGGFDYTTRAVLSDGSRVKIGTIVNKKMNVELLAYNSLSNSLQACMVTNWFNFGQGDYYWAFKVTGGANGWRQFRATGEQGIYTPDGIKSADEIAVGDLVLAQSYKYFSEDQHELILGAILGDGALRWGRDTASLTLGHGEKQDLYCRWKAAALGCRPYVDRKNRTFAHTIRSTEFSRYRSIEKRKALLHLPDTVIDALTVKAIAIWYMDDGTFSGSYKRWGYGKIELAAAKLPREELEKIAIKMHSLGLGSPTPRPGHGLMWSGNESNKFQETIARYIFSAMRYKLKSGYSDFNWNVKKIAPQLDIVQANVAEKEWRQAPRGQGKSGLRYGLEVEGGHAFLVDGVVVPNTVVL